MEIERLAQQLLDQSASVREQAAEWPEDVAAALIDYLKSEADRHWWINANHSLELADLMVEIGQTRDDSRQEALGLMARGDALKFLGRIEEAWAILGQAGTLFQAAHDEVGWGRTRIGRLLISVDLNRVQEALADGALARAIFLRHDVQEILLRLDVNTAIVHDLLGDHQQALQLYHSALAISELLGAAGEKYLGMLYTNIGYAYNYLGDFRQALAHYERAHHLFEERGETGAAAVAELDIAYIAQAQGHYRRALQILHRVQGVLAGQFPAEYASARRVMVECYLALNRYLEARDLAQQVASEFEIQGADYEWAWSLCYLARAEAELSNLDAAQRALAAADSIFAKLSATTSNGSVHLYRGRIALQQGDLAAARHEALAASADFATGQQAANVATAMLLNGQTSLAEGNLEGALSAARAALRAAQSNQVPGLRYSAHVLLGRVMEARQDLRRAAREYHAAAATVERVQRGLTVTLRPGFLEDKGEALHALIRLHLQDGRTGCALQTLERAKSQVLLGYLANRESLRWPTGNPQIQALIEELDQLRAEHHWYYRIAHEAPETDRAMDQALREVHRRERRMRAITEQLYLQNEGPSPAIAPVPSLVELQDQLDEGSLLIEFYNNGCRVYAFAVSRHHVAVYPLPVSVSELDHLIGQFQFNIACALKIGRSAAARQLALLFNPLARRLYQSLFGPLQSELAGPARLIVVPYGALHYLPFHLLHNGTGYLIEQQEIVILPAAGLATRRAPRRKGGARVLAHSWDDRLPQTRIEAQQVHARFGGELYCDEHASRTSLSAPPCQILHIAAHGEHRIEQPDLSYIHLADGQLYTDDLFQCDLSYELVTLSACETGRAHVAAGDELIGLGRGFLYAGAGALLVSSWRVDDASTVNLMDDIYQSLSAGASKAAALRDAQRAALQRDPEVHPAFWGAFQLVGDAGPLRGEE
jgi:CHAT domain-containing protein